MTLADAIFFECYTKTRIAEQNQRILVAPLVTFISRRNLRVPSWSRVCSTAKEPGLTIRVLDIAGGLVQRPVPDGHGGAERPAVAARRQRPPVAVSDDAPRRASRRRRSVVHLPAAGASSVCLKSRSSFY